MKIKLILTLTLVITLLTLAQVYAENTCSNSAKIVAPCFMVSGRLSAFNGRPTFRIFPKHSRRILGVASNAHDEPLMPIFLWDKMRESSVNVYGTFKICPLTKSKPGWMQRVCIESVSSKLRSEPNHHFPSSHVSSP